MRPSALPMLAACPRWVSSGGNDDTSAGTLRHLYFASLLGKQDILPVEIPQEDKDACQWAADYVRTHAPASDYPMFVERHVMPLDEDFTPLFENGGTLDVCCGPHLFDLKTRERDYAAQMAAYALAMFQEHAWPEVTCHLLFTETRRARVFKFTQDGAREIVMRIVNAPNSPGNERPCEYCSWCARQVECFIDLANDVVRGRDDWNLEQYHSSKITTPEEMGKALRIARHLAGWCESVEHHAKEMVKTGVVPSGYELKTRQGNRFVRSVTEAFPLLGMPQEKFLGACEVKPSALFEAYAEFNGIKKATAEKECERKLGEVLQRKPSSQLLVETKTKE